MSDSLFNFRDRRILIVGGRATILQDYVRHAAGQCARVVLTARKPDEAEAAAAALRAELPGCTVLGIGVNPLDCASLEASWPAVDAFFGGRGIDTLIAGVGGNQKEAKLPIDLQLANLDIDAWRTNFDTNLWSCLNAAKVYGGRMAVRAEPSAAIAVGSVSASARSILSEVGAYGPAKAALTQAWLEIGMLVAEQRSRAGLGPMSFNVIHPGFLPALQNAGMLVDAAGTLKPRGETIIARTPLHRFGTPADLVTPLALLSFPGFMNLQEVTVDGGWSACGVRYTS